MNRPMTYDEWIAWRSAGIGSSDAPAVMGVSPWVTRFELWARKTNRIGPQPRSFAMKRGSDLEPLARAAYEAMTGCPMPAALRVHPEHTFVRASIDGLNTDAKRVLEIKCPGKDDHITAKKGQVPAKYLWQCVHLMMVTGLPQLDYFSFDGRHGVIVTMKRNRRLERELFTEEKKFWRLIETNTPPEIPKPKPRTMVSGLFPIRRRYE